MAKGNGNTIPYEKERVSFSSFEGYTFIYKGRVNGNRKKIEVIAGGQIEHMRGLKLSNNMQIGELLSLLPGQIWIDGQPVYSSQ